MSSTQRRSLGVVAVLALASTTWTANAATTSPTDAPLTFAGTSLTAISATSADDVWAVGAIPLKQAAVIEHWDGATWSRTKIACHCVLRGVSARASDDVWAVGFGGQAVILHYDGSGWTRVEVPPMRKAELLAVSADAPDDAYAVGSATGPLKHSRRQTLVLHWDGSQWSVAPSPTARFGSAFRTVSAESPRDVLAAGVAGGGSILFTHWNGTRWKRVKDFKHDGMNWVQDVSASSPTDGWGAGAGINELCRWDGQTCTPEKAPFPGFDGQLFGVADRAPNDAWAVGWRQEQSGDPELTLIDHWDGTSWRHVDSPSPLLDGVLLDVSAPAADDAWAVGTDGTDSFVLHWDGTSWATSR